MNGEGDTIVPPAIAGAAAADAAMIEADRAAGAPPWSPGAPAPVPGAPARGPDYQGEARDVVNTLVAIAAPAFPSLAPIYTPEVCERIAAAAAPVMEKYGVSEEHRAYIFTQCTLAGAISIHLMRHGNAELWRDLIEPDEDRKEVPND